MKNDLSARLRLGDPAALEEIIDRYAPYAAKIIAAYLGRTLPPEDMDEALADVFVSLWNSRGSLEGEIRPYLAAIARNAARQKLRQFHPVEALPENADLPDRRPLPEQLLESAETAAALRQAVDAMDRESRELFIRYYFLGQTVEEVAAVTGQNAATLRTRLRRGRRKLRAYLLERGISCD